MNTQMLELFNKLCTLEAQSQNLINKLKDEGMNVDLINALLSIHEELNNNRNNIKKLIEISKNKGLP